MDTPEKLKLIAESIKNSLPFDLGKMLTTMQR